MIELNYMEFLLLWGGYGISLLLAYGLGVLAERYRSLKEKKEE